MPDAIADKKGEGALAGPLPAQGAGLSAGAY
jgi:hypothetical protein